MANVVDTSFGLDLTSFEAGLDKAIAKMGTFDKVQDDVTKGGKALDASLNSASESLANVASATEVATDAEKERIAVIEATRKAAAQAIAENDKLTDSEKRQAAAAGGITKEYDKLIATRQRDAAAAKSAGQSQLGILDQLRSRIDLLNQKKLSLTDPAEVAATNDAIRTATKEFDALNNATAEAVAQGEAEVGILEQLRSRIELLSQKKASIVDPKEIASTNDELKKVTTQFQALSTATNEAATQGENEVGVLDQLRSRIDLLNQKKLSLTDPKQIAATNTELRKVQGEFDKVNNATVKAGGGIKGMFSSLAQGAQQAATSIPGIGGLFSALTNPIGIAVAAVTGFFTNLVARSDAASKFMDGISSQFDSIGNRLTNFEGFVGLFDPRQQALDAAFAKQYATLLDDIEANQRDVNLSNAQAEKQIAGLNQRLRDRTLGEQERLKVAQDITAIEEDRAAKEERLLAKRVVLINDEVAKAKAQGIAEENLSDDLLNRQTEALVALENAQTARIALTENVERRVNSIVEQGVNERAAAQAKEDAEAEKLAAKAKARAEKRAALEKELNAAQVERLAPQQREEAQALVTRDDRVARAEGDAEQLLRIEEQFQAQLQAIRNKYGAQQTAEQDKLDAQVLQRKSVLAQSELDALIVRQNTELQTAVASGANITDLQTQQAKERQGLLTTIEDAAVQAKLEQFDIEYAAAEQQGLDLQELAIQQETELAALRGTFRATELEAIRAANEQQVQLSTELKDAEMALAGARIDAAGTVGSVLQQLSQQGSAAAIAGLAIQKGAAVANVIIQTQQGIAAAAAAAASVPPIIPGTLLPNPAYVPAQAIAAATIARLKIGAGINIATILAQAITGAYTGERRVGVGERPQLPGTRDRYLRKVHKDEGIMDAKTNMKYLPVLDRMRDGTFDTWVANITAPPVVMQRMPDFDRFLSSTTNLNTYVEQRHVSSSAPVPEFSDHGIVSALTKGQEEVRQQTRLLSAIAQGMRRNTPNPRN